MECQNPSISLSYQDKKKWSTQRQWPTEKEQKGKQWSKKTFNRTLNIVQHEPHKN